MSVTVRDAKLSDVSWLMRQLRQFAQFFGSTLSLFPDDEAEARAILVTLIEAHPFFVAVRSDREPVGFIAGTYGPHFLNKDIRTLTELFWWVDPKFRGGRAGLALLDHFLAYGKQHADWIVCSLEAESPVHPETLTRRGFHLHERSYLIEVAR